MPPIAAPRPLALASGSAYRRQLLERLGLEFSWRAPAVNEQSRPGESPGQTAARLAREKAAAVSVAIPEAIVIGSDQVAELGGRALGKPGDHASAIAQLAACAGKEVRFLTAVCVTCADTGEALEHTDITRVRFRSLSADTIEAYLRFDRPYDCAGSFKVESAGIALFEAVDSSDPTALTGLPLIWVSGALARLGRPVFPVGAEASRSEGW